MGKIQGQRVGSIKKLKQKLQSGGGAGFIKYVPKEGSIMVRFLTEPDDFYGYWEHYDDTIRRSYACVETDCPGCATDEDRNFVYLGNVLDLEDDRVVPLQLKKSVVNDLVLRYEKYDTITDRDYEIGKTGTGKSTRYYVSPEPPKARKLSKYDLLDLEGVVQAAFDENTALLDPDDDDDDEDEKPTPRKAAASKKSAPAKKAAAPAKKAPAKRAAKKDEPHIYTAEELDEMSEDELTEAAEAVGVDTDEFDDWDEVMEAILEAQSDEDTDSDDESEDDDDSDDDEEDDAEDDEDEDEEESEDEDDGDFWTEDELKAKSPGELKAIAKDYNISTKGLRPAQIIKALLEA